MQVISHPCHHGCLPHRHDLYQAPKEAILGGDAVCNAQITRDIFSGKEQGAKRDIVILNAAFALFVDGKVRDIKEAIAMAKEGLDSGKAREHLTLIAKVSEQLAVNS